MQELTTPWEIDWIEVGEIASGGQGVVTRLKHKTDPDRSAVLKQIVLRWRADKQAIDRLYRETEALTKLASVGAKVPKVYDSMVAHNDSQPFIVMELIDGVRFDEWLRCNAPMSVERSVVVVKAIADTIRLCHEADIGHRDLKPANIILKNGDERDPYLLDFGISFDSKQSIALTRDGEMFWNEFIIMPECQDLNGGHRDLRSDITAMVGIFFYCITGTPPILLRDSEERSPHQRHNKLIESSLTCPSLRERVTWFLEKGFKFKVSERFQDLDSFCNDLDALTRADDDAGIDLLEEFDRLKRVVTQKDRNVQLSELTKLYNEFAAKLNPFLVKLYTPLQKDGWKSSILGVDLAGQHSHNKPSVEGVYPLVGQMLHCSFSQAHFKAGIGIFLIPLCVDMEIQIYISSFIAPKSRLSKPEANIEWVKVCVLTQGCSLSDRVKIVMDAIRVKTAREMRNLAAQAQAS